MIAFERAFMRFGEQPGDDRFEMAAAFRHRGLRDIVRSAHDELRSRGQAQPELPETVRPDVPGAVAEVREAAREALEATNGETKGKAAGYRDCMIEAAALEPDAVPTEEEGARLSFDTKAAGFRCPEVDRYREAVRKLGCRVVELEFAPHYEYLRELQRLYALEYEALKGERSGLDFEDLQLAARRALEVNPGLRRRFRERFAHLMVDEFQDTNELQLGVIKLLHLDEEGHAGNRLFTVGDQFQSIYSFRHADLAVFRREARAAAAAPDSDAGVRRLLGNFRSRPEVLAAANAVGTGLLGKDFERLRVGAAPREASARGSGPAVELLVTEQRGWDEDGIDLTVSRDEQAQAWRVAEAQFLARRLRELADSGFPQGEMVVLLRSFTHVETYEDALDMQGLEPYVIGGRGYWSKQQVADLRCLLSVIANPLDDLALYGSLSSPCCAVSSDTLWLLSRAAGGRAVWHALRALFGAGDAPPDDDWGRQAGEWGEHVPEEDRAALREFLELLEGLRRDAPRLSLEGLIDRAVSDLGYDLAVLTRPRGERRLANVRKLMRLARDFEADEGRDLRRFLDWIDAEDETGSREAEAAVQAEHHTGVRVMTVHGAKGLEFPLVAVADLGRRIGGGFPPALRMQPAPSGEEPSHAGDEPSHAGDGALRVGLRLARLGKKGKQIFDYRELQEQADDLASAEERRVLHVALTRAKERLILSGACRLDKLGDEPTPLSPLMPRVLSALGFQEESGVLEVPGPEPREGLEESFGVVPIGVSLNIPRPVEGQAPLPAPEGAWDAHDLAEPGATEPDAELIAAIAALEEAPSVAAPAATVSRVSYSAISQWRRCGYRFYAERVLGMHPRPLGTSRAAGRGEDRDGEPSGVPDEILTAADLDGLEHRYARGRVVHELLEASSREGFSPPSPARASALLAREGVSSGEAETRRAIDLVAGFLDSPLRHELAAALTLRPEAPFAFRSGPLIVRGEIDLLADLGSEVLVIDYKSDRLGGQAPAAHMARYEVQRDIYALAALRRYGRPVRVAYVFLESPGEPLVERFEPAASAALGEQLAAVCAEIAGGSFDVTDKPERALCHDCPARERLCVHPPERTLAA